MAKTPDRIDSRENRWLKRFRGALQARPEKDGAPLGVEGPRLVGEALRSGLAAEALLISDSGERQLTRLRDTLHPKIRILRTSDRLFATVAGTETPQGVAALIEPPHWRPADLFGAAALVVVLAGVQDPGNMGTIIRAAEAFGASGVIACTGSAHPFGPKAVRASAGSVFRLPTLAGSQPADVLDELRGRGLRQFAAVTTEGPAPPGTDLTQPCALWIGSEGGGLPEEVQRAADATIRIPLRDTVDSLNAASAATVLLYEAARQRGRMGQLPESTP